MNLKDLLAPPPGMEAIDFAKPRGAPALYPADSVAWRVMKNPVALMVGGIAAVLLELAEPRVRSGVWEHTDFRNDPAGRMRRTGFAALCAVYAPADQARALISRVSRLHAAIRGVTPAQVPYRADDPELLRWVYATAQFGFVEAYHRFVRALPARERDQFFAEGARVAPLWGAADAPQSDAEIEALFDRTRPHLERSGIVFEFLDIVRRAPVLPALARPIQALAIRGAIDITPPWLRELLGIDARLGLNAAGRVTLRFLGAAADRLAIDAPPAQACTRLGLPRGYLYR